MIWIAENTLQSFHGRFCASNRQEMPVFQKSVEKGQAMV
jgi:hypothetical protein